MPLFNPLTCHISPGGEVGISLLLSPIGVITKHSFLSLVSAIIPALPSASRFLGLLFVDNSYTSVYYESMIGAP